MKSFSPGLVVLGVLLAGCATQDAARAPAAPATSSYACQDTPVPGMPAAGQGQYGCHFVLLHPETKKVLANTRYQLDVYAPGNGRESIATLSGQTDAQGRSGFVRAPHPIEPKLVRFVQVVGNGKAGGTPRLLRPTDGQPMGGKIYLIEGCGEKIQGVTDEQGYAVMLASEKECKFSVRYYERRQ